MTTPTPPLPPHMDPPLPPPPFSAKPPQPAGEQQFSEAQVAQAFAEAQLAPGIQHIALDTRYWALPADEWDKLIAAKGEDKRAYTPERYDCDDFGFSFKGEMCDLYAINGIGLVLDWSGRHCYNCLLVVGTDVNHPLELHFLEPQQDKWIRVERKDGPACYSLTEGMIIL